MYLGIWYGMMRYRTGMPGIAISVRMQTGVDAHVLILPHGDAVHGDLRRSDCRCFPPYLCRCHRCTIPPR